MSIQGVETAASRPVLSVVVAAEAMAELAPTLHSVRDGIEAMNLAYEVICVTDGRDSEVIAALAAISSDWPELTVLPQRPWSGEDGALAIALRRASGRLVLTLPGWPEVDPVDFAALYAALGDADMISAVRERQPGGSWQRVRRALFEGALRRLFGEAPGDPFCRVRIYRRDVVKDVNDYGVRQHFIPIIAAHRGYKIKERTVRSAPRPVGTGSYVFRPGGHLLALFDALTLFVVLKFLRRPLRFFGLIGLPIFLVGAVATTMLVVQRLMGLTALADRPALIFSVMMIVLGIQIIAIGLVGEIIIYSRARRLKQYQVRELIQSEDIGLENGRHTAEAPGSVSAANGETTVPEARDQSAGPAPAPKRAAPK